MTVALGCMRLGADGGAVVRAAHDAGVRIFDTARAYPGNEELVGAALAGREALVISKGGMARPDGGWRPDGRRVALRADVEASRAALGRDIDLYLLHAVDPEVPLATSVRALRDLQEEGLVRAIGLANVNRRQLDEALALAPIAAVQVSLSWRDLDAWQGGVVERCLERGLQIFAHTPLGGSKRAQALAKNPHFARVAERHGVSPQVIALAWLHGLHPAIVPVAGATRTSSAASLGRIPVLSADDLAGLPGFPRRPTPVVDSEREVVLIMGPQGSGKSTAALALVDHERLNRDQRGGSLSGLARALEARLAAGVSRLVLDNTYVTRAQRREVIDTAWRHGARVRGVWLDAPLERLQVNVIRRMLAAHGRLLAPEELGKPADDPTRLPPLALLRMRRELEPPSLDEGFAELERGEVGSAPFGERAGRFVALEALAAGVWGDEPARLVFAWRPEGELPDLREELAVCRHPGGPPRCWCRPPLPGLVLAFCQREGVDPARSTLVGTTATHRAMAQAIGARYAAA